jgi:ActR/RegA family two-component response regulator
MKRRIRILVVDDDANLASNLQDILEESGYSVMIAENGKTAAILCKKKRYDIALVDVMLPDESGIALVDKLTKLSPQMDCIIITGYASMESAVEAVKQKQIVAYETKPLDMNRLLPLIRQITDRKDAEGRLKEYTKRLEEIVVEHTRTLREGKQDIVERERMAAMAEFLHGVSVELKEPLEAVDRSVNALKVKLKGADRKVHQHLIRIKSNASNAAATIDCLLNLTQMKKPELSSHDLVSITSNSIASSRIQGAVEVINDFPSEKIPVSVDKRQIRMALKNLINNTIVALGHKGKLIVRIRKTRGNRAELSFTERGSRISKDKLENLLDQLSDSGAKGPSTSLSIAKRIVENHGGTIKAGAKQGEGGALVVRLPVDAS